MADDDDDALQHLKLSASENEEEDENEFYDAVAEGGGGTPNTGTDGFTLSIPTGGHRRNSSDSSSETEDTQETKQVVVLSNKQHAPDMGSPETTSMPSGGGGGGGSQTPTGGGASGRKQRRLRVPDKPNYPLSLWSIMKNCIGKDLSKIPMPVNFNEPLSMLQRLAEDFEYSELLDQAAKCTDPSEQLAYVAAFTISAYSTTSNRTGKPFNPLLGETYEFDRQDDLGWRLVSEQVSHHPPMVAQHCEGRGWRCWQEFTMTSKFRGKYLQIVPLGTAHLEFTATGNRYTWRKVTTTVHNIIVGKLWVDQHGDMEITGRGAAQDIKCHLKYIPYSYFSRDTQRRVKGVVLDRSDNVKWVINGTWDDHVEIAPVVGNVKSQNSSTSIYETGSTVLAWKRRQPPAESEKFYNFTLLACQLNEPEDDVAPTDSRRRPDQRLMEVGSWNEANDEKLRIEEKQRSVRRAREAAAEKAASEGTPFEPYKPLWFEQHKDEETDVITHVYKGNYWESKDKKEWNACPDIF